MEAVSFHLQVFEGPLDLLMHLLKKNKLSIYDIHIASITEQFFAYLEQMDELNMEISSEFLVVAAQLLLIKSRMLLPKYDEEEEEDDPRKELIDRLEEYKKYKLAADIFEDAQHHADDLYFGTGESFDFGKQVVDENLHIPIEKLLLAVANILERGERKAPPSRDSFKGIVGHVKVSVSEKANYISRLLRKKKTVRFREIFAELETKPEVVAAFLAVLEMIKEGRIKVQENGNDFLCSEGEHANEYE